jgi:hypothetical protein
VGYFLYRHYTMVYLSVKQKVSLQYRKVRKSLIRKSLRKSPPQCLVAKSYAIRL